MHKTNESKTAGYTLLELMLTIALIAIIASIAISSYITRDKKSHYNELIRATAPYKLGVTKCYAATGNLLNCNSTTAINNSIPPSIIMPPNPKSVIGKITVTNGVISAVPNPIAGIKADEIYVLTPSAANGEITWIVSGKGVADGLTQ